MDCASNSGTFVLPHVICDAKITVNLKQIRKIMKINAVMNTSTIIAMIKTRIIIAIVNSVINIIVV
jgi:hypothetical protein